MTLIVNSVSAEDVVTALKKEVERAENIQLVVSTSDVNVRTEMLEGREHLVAPVVMLTEGVHKGSGGPMMYTKNELRKTAKSWNHKPVVVYHPRENGGFVSACKPSVLTSRKIGVVLNAKYGKENGIGRLTAECWIDPARCRAVDDRVLKATINKDTMELSTGLFSTSDGEPGVYNGEEYSGVMRDMNPDHLAILPDEIGACSVADGAGYIRNETKDDNDDSLPRLSQDFTNAYFPILRAAGLDTSQLIFNDLSHDDVRTMLIKLTHKKWDDMAWVEEVFDDFYVFSHKDKLYAQEYVIDNEDKITLINMRQEVVRDIRYKTTSGIILSNTEKEPQMTKEEKVAKIIKLRNNSFAPGDEEVLMALEDATLDKMDKDPEVPAPTDGSPEVPAPVAAPISGMPTPDPEADPAADADPQDKEPTVATVEEYVNSAPAEIRPAIRGMHANYVADKTKVVTAIMANKANQFTKEQLDAKDLTELSQINALSAVATKSFQGRLGVNTSTKTALSVPKMKLNE